MIAISSHRVLLDEWDTFLLFYSLSLLTVSGRVHLISHAIQLVAYRIV